MYTKLLKIIGNRNSTYCSLINIKTEEEKQEVLDFIKAGNNKYGLVNAFCNVIQSKRLYREGKIKLAIKKIDTAIHFWTHDYKPFLELREKMKNGEDI